MFATTSWIAALIVVTSLSRAPSNELLQSLSGATTWIGARPLSAQELRGKVVVVNFWTYTRINWRRTMPYLRAWGQRYKDGVVLVGVHSPEFEFERDVENVRQAVRDIDIPFPVAVDNDFTVWQAFDNQHWPALYVFDAQGRLRHRQSGEDGYEKAERVIRQLLGEARQQFWSFPPEPPGGGRGAEVPADWEDLRSAENYLDLKRTRGFSSPEGLLPGERQRYTFPLAMEPDEWALSGTWAVRGDRVVSSAAAAKIAYRFHARDLHLVMAPETRGKAIRFRVLIDGKPPGVARGADVDAQGYGTLRDQRMYQLIRQPAPITGRLFEIQFLDAGAAAFCFTFG